MTPAPHHGLIDRCIEAYDTLDVPECSSHQPAIEFESRANGETTPSASGVDELRRPVQARARMFSARRQSITTNEPDGDATASATPSEERKRLSRAGPMMRA